MKNKLLLVGLLLLLFLVVIGVRFFIADTQNVMGQLKIDSSPEAGVFVDNAALGKTPFEAPYKPGEYILKLIPAGDATATASWQGKIKINNSAITYVNRELGPSDIASAGEIFTVSKMDKKPSSNNVGEIYVETEPTGSIVYLDNDEKGIAPLILSDVPTGDHEISIFMPGFLRRTQKVNIDAGYRVNTQFKLAIDEKAKPTPVASTSATVKPTDSAKKSTEPVKVIISDTPTGYLRVREEPTVNASESAQVKPGDTFPLLEEQTGWYKIEYEKGKTGWVSAQYSQKK